MTDRDTRSTRDTSLEPSHAVTCGRIRIWSAAETEALLQRLSDVQGERERATSPQQLHAELRAVWQREHQLLDQLTVLLDDAQRALCEALPPLPGADAGEGGGDDPPITEAPR